MTTLQKILITITVAVLAGAGIYETTQFIHRPNQGTAPGNQTNPGGGYVSRDQFAFAGYATPEATIKSLFWTQIKGDFNGTLESASPKFHAVLEQAVKAAPGGEKTIVNSITSAANNYLGYRIASMDKISNDTIIVTVLVDDARLKGIGPNDKGYNALLANSQKTWRLVRVNSEWKYDGGANK